MRATFNKVTCLKITEKCLLKEKIAESFRQRNYSVFATQELDITMYL